MADGTVVTLKMEYGIVVSEEKNSISRSTMAYNSRTAIWKSGQWLVFYSRINIDENGVTNVSYSQICNMAYLV
jgi:hypothetical protein